MDANDAPLKPRASSASIAAPPQPKAGTVSLPAWVLLHVLVAAAVALPFALLHCDPLIDDHGYFGDETMLLTLALSGAVDGVPTYDTNPDGTPRVWRGWLPLLTVAYGFPLSHADPVQRVEMGRLVSRVLCFIGVLAWALTTLSILSDGQVPNGRWMRGSLVGCFASLMFLSFPPMAFIASFGRNDSLGFLLVCLTYCAASAFIRHFTSPLAAAALVLVASVGFWGHFVALLFSGYVALVALALGAYSARQHHLLPCFARAAATGLLSGASLVALLLLLVSGLDSLSDPIHQPRTEMLTAYSRRFIYSFLDMSDAVRQGVLRWLWWKEVPVAFLSMVVSALGLSGLRRQGRGGMTTWAPGPVILALVQLPLLAAVVGAVIRAYQFHDVYRPFVLAAALSTLLLSLQVQSWDRVPRQRVALATLVATALGLSAVARLDRRDFERFPNLWTEWSGYRPFAHSWSSLPEAASHEVSHRAANHTREAHLRQLNDYLAERRVRGLITLDPMLLLLRRRDLAIYYFHFQVPPKARLPEAEENTLILRDVALGRGVRLIAATRNGLADNFVATGEPLRDLRLCLGRNWTRSHTFDCSVGRTLLSVTLEWRTTSEGPPYVYGSANATPIRLYRLTRIVVDDSARP